MKRAMVFIFIAVLAILTGIGWWAYTPDLSRGDLEAKYGVTSSDYIEVAGARLRFRDTGPRGAPAVVLIHGFGSSLDTWDTWADTLSEHYRVVRYDLPGFALSGADPTGDYSETRAVTVLSALLDKLGIARASLIGNSIGGKLAWEFAAAHPSRVEKLILVSPDGFASPGFEYDKKPAVPAMVRMLPYVLPKSFLRMNLAPAYGNQSALTDAIVTRYWEMMRAPGARGAMIDRLGQTVLENPEPILRRIETPTLLIWGEKDGMIPFTNSADYVRDMPNVRLVPLAGIGHVPQEEAPAPSLHPILAFLAEPDAPRNADKVHAIAPQ